MKIAFVALALAASLFQGARALRAPQTIGHPTVHAWPTPVCPPDSPVGCPPGGPKSTAPSHG